MRLRIAFYTNKHIINSVNSFDNLMTYMECKYFKMFQAREMQHYSVTMVTRSNHNIHVHGAE